MSRFPINVYSCPFVVKIPCCFRSFFFTLLFLAALTTSAEDRAAAYNANLGLPPTVEFLNNIPFGKGGETVLRMVILRPNRAPDAVAPAGAARMPVVLFVHGGGWSAGNKRSALPLLVPLAERGYFCASIDYRLSKVALFPAAVHDVKTAVRFLRAKADEYHLDPDRIAVWGNSAGGHLAALVGTSGGVKDLEGNGDWPEFSSRVQAVCDWFGPTDLNAIDPAVRRDHRLAKAIQDFLGGPIDAKRELARVASPITYVTSDDPPFLIMHGDLDAVVPLAQSEKLRDVLRRAGVRVELEIVKGAGHSLPPAQVKEKVLPFFESVWSRTGPAAD